jgi:hypothetical protein
MNLADYIVAAPGTVFDLFKSMTNLASTIRHAERFEMSDDVVKACAQLVDSKPSTLLAALPMCRLPYNTMWIEYRGGINAERNTRDASAPIPLRQGFLIESDGSGQVGCSTLAWIHREKLEIDCPEAPFTTPFAVYFDWRPDGDVRDVVREAHEKMLEKYPAGSIDRLLLERTIRWIEGIFLSTSTAEETSRFFMLRSGWQEFADNQTEIEAMRRSETHMAAGISPHGADLLIGTMAAGAFNDPKEVRKMLQNWLSDIQGEGVFMECFLAMLNSRNVIKNEAIDLSRLNKARKKRGKSPLLNYTKTKIVLSKARSNAASAQGIDHETARQHLVRGHFKIRRTGVFWWSPFIRGDIRKGTVEREEYEVI